ncbi:hypothetical protein ACIBL8_16450 [Streptomyces sp. NPDC050523]|uniref:hypothetical protein n=1 Tax=Streptomyces sp. NPDC050523 TaxID=3365622 RepID=UPI00378C23AB
MSTARRVTARRVLGTGAAPLSLCAAPLSLCAATVAAGRALAAGAAIVVVTGRRRTAC